MPRTGFEYGGQKHGSKDWRVNLALRMHRESNPQRLARLARGYSLRRLSKETGFRVETLSRQEKGSKDVFIYDLGVIAKALGIPPTLMILDWLKWRRTYVQITPETADLHIKKAIDLYTASMEELEKPDSRKEA